MIGIPTACFASRPDASREEGARIVRGLKNVIAEDKDSDKIQTIQSRGFYPLIVNNVVLSLLLSFASGLAALAQPFHLPTANQAFRDRRRGEVFCSDTRQDLDQRGFGCVRSGGRQMHEGLDIKCLQRDRRGEPADPVLATADGTVAYINDRPSLSNYGRYIVLRHTSAGMEIYSLYAHLSEIRSRPQAGPGRAGGRKNRRHGPHQQHARAAFPRSGRMFTSS